MIHNSIAALSKAHTEQIPLQDINVGLSNDNPREQPATTLKAWKLLKMLNRQQFLVFLASWLAWIFDSFDYHSVTVTVPEIAHTFGKKPSQIVWAITLALLFRSVGAIAFGFAGDRYGRKWPLVICCLHFGVADAATGLSKTYLQFLVIRAVYGIALGGIWGCAMGVALENMPHECRGIYSGILQQGYAVGYLFAAVMNYALTGATSQGWRLLFWFGLIPAVLIALFRALLPDDDTVRRNIPDRIYTKRLSSNETSRLFFKELKYVVKNHPYRIIHAILMMAAFNFTAHGLQDLFPTFLLVQRGLDSGKSTWITVIFNFGGILGGFLYSQKFGRRAVMIAACIIAVAVVPLWTLPHDWRILALGSFLLQFCVQGAWGIVPIHLNEISPSPALRAAFSGIAYQFGNAISASSAQIISQLAESHTTIERNGKEVPDYAKIQQIFMLVVLSVLIVLIGIGPEMKGRLFEREIGESTQKDLLRSFREST